MKINILFDHEKMYYFWAFTMCYCLRKIGIESDFFSLKKETDSQKVIYPDADYYIILNHIYFGFKKNISENVKYIGWITGPVDFSSQNPVIQNRTGYNREKTEWCEYILTTNLLEKEELEKKGIKVHGAFGFAYDEILNPYIYSGKYFRNIDALFCGSNTDRRRDVIYYLKNKINNFVHKENYWNENYYELLSHAKISLNIYEFDNNEVKNNFAIFRILSSMLQKCLVISEPMRNSSPFVNGKHLILCDVKDMPSMVQYYLNNPQKRQKITNNAFDFLVNEYRMDNFLLEFIQAHIDSSAKIICSNPEIPVIQWL